MSEDYDFSDTDCDKFPSAAVVIGCIIGGLLVLLTAMICAVLP